MPDDGTNVLISEQTFASGSLMAERWDDLATTMAMKLAAMRFLPRRDMATSVPFELGTILRMFRFMETLCLHDTILVPHPGESQQDPVCQGADSHIGVALDVCIGYSDSLAAILDGAVKLAYRRDLADRARAFIAAQSDSGAQCSAETAVTRIPTRQGSRLWGVQLSAATGLSYVTDPVDGDMRKALDSIPMRGMLRRLYAAASRQAEKQIKELYPGGTTLFIPPIPALVLSQASRPRDVPDILLSIRERMRPLRKALREYEAVRADESLPLKERLDVVTQLKDVGKDLASGEGERSILSIAEWRDALDLLPDPEKGFKYGGLAKFLLDRPLRLIVSTVKRRKFLYLFGMSDAFLKIKEYGALLRKVYGVDLKASDAYTLSILREGANVYVEKFGMP
jgi:hypothetical protein